MKRRLKPIRAKSQLTLEQLRAQAIPHLRVGVVWQAKGCDTQVYLTGVFHAMNPRESSVRFTTLNQFTVDAVDERIDTFIQIYRPVKDSKG